MIVGITSDIKKYYNTQIDIIDHNWINYFKKQNIDFIQFPNSLHITNRILKNKKIKLDLIIFPGGCDINKEKINLIRIQNEKRILKFAIDNKVPVLGICHGMQLINVYFKGKLSKIDSHMKKRIKVKVLEKSLFKKEVIFVKCYHNFGILKKFLGRGLEILGIDNSNNIEIFQHKKYKIYGFMFHPEREKNFKKLNYIFKHILKY